MKLDVMIFAAVLGGYLAVMTPPAQAATSGWKCKASKLKSYKYTGGSKAYIHLRPYGRGGWYRVTRAGSKKAYGKTKNGTSFTCTRA